MSTYLADKAKCHRFFETIVGAGIELLCNHRVLVFLPLFVSFSLLLLTCCEAAELPVPSLFKSCHLELNPAQAIEASLRYDLQVETISGIRNGCLVYACVPPNLARQKIKSAQLSIVPTRKSAMRTHEFSSQKRQVLELRLHNALLKNRVSVIVPLEAKYSAVLFRSRLVPGPSAEYLPEPSEFEKQSNLCTSYSLDFKNEFFQQWMTNKKLRRRTDESCLQFAFRIYNYIRNRYVYRWDRSMDRRISATCLVRASDCGGLSYLFCGILRANGIPARALIGRWAQSTATVEDDSSFFNCHVKSEFFISGIGWIPVDISKNMSDPKDASHFGEDSGDFLVMHCNPDLVLPDSGEKMTLLRSIPDFRILGISHQKRNIHWKVESQSLR